MKDAFAYGLLAIGMAAASSASSCHAVEGSIGRSFVGAQIMPFAGIVPPERGLIYSFDYVDGSISGGKQTPTFAFVWPAAFAETSSGSKTEPVTADNFIRAESDSVFTGLVAQGGFGKFFHSRDVTPVDSRIVQRPNRDTLYSTAVFDLDAGPVTITLPDAGERFLTMIVIDEDHYVFTVVYGAGRHTITKDKIGTRYATAAIRILVDTNDQEDLARVHALQDAVKVDQPDGAGKFEVPNWDPASQQKVRGALVTLGETIPDWRHAAGGRNEVDAVRHLIVTATGWGLNPDKDAIYLNVTPSKNDGTTIYKLDMNDVPVDGFWSISLYGPDGYFHENKFNAYTLNNLTVKKAADGSIGIQFGGCDGKIPNCLPITPGWNYMVRLYRPRAEILNATWKFPEAKPAG